MNIQIIKSIDGKAEYALLPIAAYQALKHSIDNLIAQQNQSHRMNNTDYVPFNVEDYVTNPVALARIHANITQEELAALLGVSQAYISKLEAQSTVTPKTLAKVQAALQQAQEK